MNTKCNEKTHCHLMRVVELLLVILVLYPQKPLDELHYEKLLMKIKKKNERKLICVLKLKNIIFIHSYLISENFLNPVFKPEACFSKVQIMLLKKLLFLFFMITLFMNLIHKFIEKCYYEILWMTYCYQILQSHPFLAALLSCAFPETKINWRE